MQKTDGCWLWTLGKDRNGYGLFWFPTHVGERAHRFAWSITHGAIPAGLYVLHSCDTPSCVRPDHLRLGTQRENIRESIAKGRHKHPAMGRRGGPLTITRLRHA